MSENKNWFALYTKPRQEFKAEIQITSENITCYLPTITRTKRWSDRKKKVTEPLFNGYIFLFAGEKERLIAVEQKSVVRTIFFNGKPAVIPPCQIESLKKMLDTTHNVTVLTGLVKGTHVKIADGPFSGVEGIICSISKDETMLGVGIDLLNRTVLVKLPADSVTKLS